MRLHYRIFVPVNKPEPPAVQKQEAPVVQKEEAPIVQKQEAPAPEPEKPDAKNETPPPKKETKPETPPKKDVKEKKPEDVKKDDAKKEKHVKIAEKPQEKPKEAKTYGNCVYDYTEPDKDEIKAFAEKRDREWALQKQEEEYNHVSKKRKKNKHSKSEFMHKKRKLHAEITSNEVLSKPEDSLKLKVKLSVANGHKHKHRSFEPPKQELTAKEKLLQMRQVRHKKIDEKKVDAPVVPQYKVVPVEKKEKEDVKVEKKDKEVKSEKSPDILSSGKTLRSDFSIKTSLSKDICSKFVSVNVERCAEAAKIMQKKSEAAQKAQDAKNGEKKVNESKPKVEQVKKEMKELKKEVKEMKKEVKLVEMKKEAKLVEMKKEVKQVEMKKEVVPLLDKIKEEPKEEKVEKVQNSLGHMSAANEYVTKNFTVSKIEAGAKRKAEDKIGGLEKRPSLEITLISPVQKPQVSSTQTKPTVKTTDSVTPKPKAIRPPPATIPLVRIQKSLNLKTGISIIPKMPEKCDNIGALDLSKPSKTEARPDLFRSHSESPRPVHHPVIPRPSSASPKIGNSVLSPKTPGKVEKVEGGKGVSPNITNLQMLSDSAVKRIEVMTKVPNGPIPNLIKKSPQLKIPMPQNSGIKSPSFPSKNFLPHSKTPIIPNKNPVAKPPSAPSLLQKPNFFSKTLQRLPNLKEINKGQFNRLNTAIRNARPAQNQSIRNIPNPSLIVRQQNQNRINLVSQNPELNHKEPAKAAAAPKPAEKCTEEHKKDLEITKTLPALKQIEPAMSK